MPATPANGGGPVVRVLKGLVVVMVAAPPPVKTEILYECWKIERLRKGGMVGMAGMAGREPEGVRELFRENRDLELMIS